MGHSKHKKHHRHDSDDDDKRRRKRRSPTPSSTDGSSSSTDEDEYREKRVSNKGKTMEEIEEERRVMKDDERRQREMRKVYETPHEKRQRRLAKKTEKERKKKEELGWDAEHMGMTNASNPFGDTKLTDTFVWHKKLEKKGLSDVPADHLKAIQSRRVEENKTELEKLKKQRLERERIREEMEKEKEFLQRVKEAEYYHEWEKQEDSFHYTQVRLRSKIRIKDGRAKPIDLLAYYIDDNDDDDELAVELHEPSTYLNGLNIRDLEDLLADIGVYTDLQKQKQQKSGVSSHYDKQYWDDITTITKDELSKLRRSDYNQRMDDRRDGINSAVSNDVDKLIKNKTPQQLEQLEQRIESKIKNETGIDVGYWESLLSQLQVHIARARLHDRHQLTLKRKLQKFKQEQGIFHAPISTKTTTMSSTSTIPKKKKESDNNNQLDSFDNESESFEDLEQKCVRDYDQGRYSPILVQINDLDLEIQKRCTDENDDWDKLKQQRESVMKSGSIKPDVEDAFEQFARSMGSLTSDDSVINTVVPMDVQYLWSDKYRPRKPRVFNKVHTGYDWNQYNKKHYDTDNPPPKTVQGYKFNIFYPDLIDKTKTPSYSLTVCEDNRDFSILKFHAGPPYEDIAFKIVSKEWDYSYKHGFRCHFQNGIFQLWFHFRKWKYRR